MENVYNPRLLDLLSKCDEVVLFPFTLSIVDCYAISNAIGRRRCSIEGPGGVSSIEFQDVFDFYSFDRSIDEADVFLVAEDHPLIVLNWDRDNRFVLVAGDKAFCDRAAPYPAEVRRHYFLEAVDFDASGRASSIYRELVER